MPTCPTCEKTFGEELATCPDDGAVLLPDEIAASMDHGLAAGTMVGEYKVESKLGEGGFGAVYKAVHPLIGKAAAIKVLHRQYSSNAQMVSRFIAEARAVNQIRHKNIIDVFAFGTLPDGRQYYVMELLRGLPFDALIKKRGCLAPRDAIPILRGIARALDAAHKGGIVHRDLKPENVFLLTDEDGIATPKLLDFGIAKLAPDGNQTHKTKTGTAMGTPYYMSPEQARGLSVDYRTDIYSFGALTFEALTGDVPFRGESTMDVLLKHMTEAVPLLETRVPGLENGNAVIARMMAKEPEQRFASVGESLDALAAAFGIALPQLAPGSLRDFMTGPETIQGVSSSRTVSDTEHAEKLPSSAALAKTTPAGKPAARVDAHSQTFLSAESDVPALQSVRPRRRPIVFVVLVVALVAGIGVTALVATKAVGGNNAGATGLVSQAATLPSASIAAAQSVPINVQSTSIVPVEKIAAVADAAVPSPGQPKKTPQGKSGTTTISKDLESPF